MSSKIEEKAAIKERKKVLAVTSGKRKTAVATAIFRLGSGNVTINRVPVELLQPVVAREKIIQILLLLAEEAKKYDIEVKVKGGGFMGQAEAAAMAIARGLVKLSSKKRYKDIIEALDRRFIAGDYRRAEPKKFGGPGPRRRVQKSYR